jgi:hypothetical protein
MSTMLPISVPRGANIISSARVARLMHFMVTMAQRKTGTRACSAAFKHNLFGCRLRQKMTHGTLKEKKVS